MGIAVDHRDHWIAAAAAAAGGRTFLSKGRACGHEGAGDACRDKGGQEGT